MPPPGEWLERLMVSCALHIIGARARKNPNVAEVAQRYGLTDEQVGWFYVRWWERRDREAESG